MREIKFRAWDKDVKVMILIFDSTNQKEWYLPNLHERYEIMQYTGLKDKNGREIYEGDIVKLSNASYLTNYKVRFGGGQWECYTPDDGRGDPNTEELYGWNYHGWVTVIGNIYENPELWEP